MIDKSLPNYLQIQEELNQYTIVKKIDLKSLNTDFQKQLITEIDQFLGNRGIEPQILASIDPNTSSQILYNLFDLIQVESRARDYSRLKNSEEKETLLKNYIYGRPNEVGQYIPITINNLSDQILRIKQTQQTLNNKKIYSITDEVQNIQQEISDIEKSDSFKKSQTLKNIIDDAISRVQSLKLSNETINVERNSRNDAIEKIDESLEVLANNERVLNVEKSLRDVLNTTIDKSLNELNNQIKQLDQEVLTVVSGNSLPQIIQSKYQQDKFLELLIDMEIAKEQISFAKTIQKNAKSSDMAQYKLIAEEIIRSEKIKFENDKNKLIEDNMKFNSDFYKSIEVTQLTNDKIYRRAEQTAKNISNQLDQLSSFTDLENKTFPKFKGSKEYIANHIIYNKDAKAVHRIVGSSIYDNGKLNPKKVVFFNEVFRMFSQSINLDSSSDKSKEAVLSILKDFFIDNKSKNLQLTKGAVELFESQSGKIFIGNRLKNEVSMNNQFDNLLQKYNLSKNNYIKAFNIIGDYKNNDSNLFKDDMKTLKSILEECTTKKWYIFGSPHLNIEKLSVKINDHLNKEVKDGISYDQSAPSIKSHEQLEANLLTPPPKLLVRNNNITSTIEQVNKPTNTVKILQETIPESKQQTNVAKINKPPIFKPYVAKENESKKDSPTARINNNSTIISK